MNPHKRGMPHEYLLCEDNVECILNVIRKEGLTENSIRFPDTFTLTLRVRVPPTAGFLMYYWHGPTIIIDECIGKSDGRPSPDWLETVQTERRFWQGRMLMLEMLLYFVGNIPHNSKASSRVTSWCGAMSLPVSDGYRLRASDVGLVC
ncbi:hypothetical protein BDN70DRAFT_936028 [Pholiota conissans]|uniref:Uncharacterized protein n=1 Tax=Pholiota conissans TaxID=109636 RepID=A0A9P5YWN7_9AGAR|nr:hypothetical protein BDN70DRAFT_936028 [Pholiota conissans]